MKTVLFTIAGLFWLSGRKPAPTEYIYVVSYNAEGGLIIGHSEIVMDSPWHEGTLAAVAEFLKRDEWHKAPVITSVFALGSDN